MKRKLLVTGAGGMVGHYARGVFSDFDLILSDASGSYEKLDVTDEKATRRFIAKVKPHLVLHLAALTDVDKCQLDSKSAYGCNRDGTATVASACKDAGAIMVYISSGSVFSGKLCRPARESDPPDPVNTYGKSKLAGEEEVRRILPRHYIIRAGWMMGGGPEKDKKFIGKIMKKITEDASIKVINDKFGSPTYAKDLLGGIKKLLPHEQYGIYHMVNESAGGCSRYDMTLAIKGILKNNDITITPVSSDEFNLSAPRAYSEALDNFRLKEMKLDLMRGWKEALAAYMAEDWSV
ncbi:MAG: SDR family oxidoreductase [Candidatus Omnitrophica bacterium]|nr:SDR family oxidoreductase [Candidatus Omnitrophota bacterium]